MRRRSIMKKLSCGFIVFFVFHLVGFAADNPALFTWQASAPHEQGLSDAKIEVLRQGLAEHGTAGLFVIRHDRVVCEWYSDQSGPDQKHYTASLAKALVGGMSLVLALQDGLLKVDDPASDYIREWKDDATRTGITIKGLATHSSGVEDAEVQDMGHYESGGWKSRFWLQEPDPFTISRDWAPLKFKPGTSFEYSNPGMALLSYCITAALQKTQYKDVRTLLRERIMRPIGVEDSEWQCGYGKTFNVNGLDLVANWGGGNYTARAVARVGRLMLHKGNWQGQQIIKPEFVKLITADAGTPDPDRGPGEGPCPRAGLAWWVNSDGNLSKLPKDAFMGAGAGNQVLLVIPSLDIVAVRMGDLMIKDSFWGGIEKYFLNPLVESVEK